MSDRVGGTGIRRARVAAGALVMAASLGAGLPASPTAPPAVQGAGTFPTILFVTQPPFPSPSSTVNNVFGNHNATTQDAPRGGDLYIRYGDGTLRNLTAEAGFGLEPTKEIAVREPTVHWSGSKALFSMVIGGTTPGVDVKVRWQIYEVTGLGKSQKVKITKLPQPEQSNNVSPFYGTDERILFTSDLPRNKDFATYPQLDEYESDEIVTGIWSMDRKGNDLKILDHSPSGDFTPVIDSAGRIIFSRWDHLQRDQQNVAQLGDFGATNYPHEFSKVSLGNATEIFPEPIFVPEGSPEFGHAFNFFFPWQMNEDGSGMEVLNHVGRHELLSFVPANKPGLFNFYLSNHKDITGLFLHLKEDPKQLGTFVGTTCPEFYTHAAGQIVSINGGDGVNPDDMKITYVTHPVSRAPLPDGQPPPAGHPGLFRNPLPLSNGSLVAVRTSSPYKDKQVGPSQLSALYDFHLSRLEKQGEYWVPVERLIPNGIVKNVQYFDNYIYGVQSYNGPLWELDPVEVRSRKKPKKRKEPLPEIESKILKEELGGPAGVKRLQNYLKGRRLALVVSRDVTRRADGQQEINLKIEGSPTQTSLPGKTPVEIEYLQFLQGDLVRGYTNFFQGRRALAQPMHDGVVPPLEDSSPPGSVKLGEDGSMAAFVPAERALTWQLTKSDGTPVVRERYWVTFAPGEMRTCANCHGLNHNDVVKNEPTPTNPPQALRDLVRWYRDVTGNGLVGDTIGVFDRSTGSAQLRNSNKSGPADVAFTVQGWTATQIPLVGDWNGDGIDTFGSYDPSTGTFRLRNKNQDQADDVVFTFGPPGNYVPIVGDWDGNSTDNIGLYEPATAKFYLRFSNDAGPADAVFVFGPGGDAVPVAGDFDGDRRGSVGVYLPSTGEWLLRNTLDAGPPHAIFVFTNKDPDSLPIMGDWDNTGVDTPGLYQPSTGTFLLRMTNGKAGKTVKFQFGPAPGQTPLAGDFNGG